MSITTYFISAALLQVPYNCELHAQEATTRDKELTTKCSWLNSFWSCFSNFAFSSGDFCREFKASSSNSRFRVALIFSPGSTIPLEGRKQTNKKTLSFRFYTFWLLALSILHPPALYTCHICLMASPAGKCQLPLELCPYPWNGPLPTVSPLDGYKLQYVLARNWMSEFIATSVPFPPAENDKQEYVLLLLDKWTWEKNSKALLPVWGQIKQRMNSQEWPTDVIQQDRHQGQHTEGFPQPKGQKMPMRHISAARLIAPAPLKALQAANLSMLRGWQCFCWNRMVTQAAGAPGQSHKQPPLPSVKN